MSVSQRPSGGSLGRLASYIFAFTLIFTVLLWTGLNRENADVAALLQGPDDFMRMVQVIDWLDGQDWSDLVQRRLNPPTGVALHWSRLADLPVAAVIWLTDPWVGRDRAVYLAVLLVPPLFGGLFIVLFLWATLPLVPDRSVRVPFMMIGTLVYPLFQFRPGRVDHHGLQLLLTVLAIGFLMRALESGRARSAVGLGIAGGTSLALGLETLPFLGAVTVILSLVWTVHGGQSATSLAVFGLAATGTVLTLIPVTLPQTEWTAIVCDRMSPAHGALTAVVLAAGGCAFILERWQATPVAPARLAAVGGVGLTGLVLTAVTFPHCLGDPYATLPGEVRYWLDAVSEAQSLLALFHDNPGFGVSIILLPLAALVVLTAQGRQSADRTEPRWIALLVLVLSSVILVAWQVRGVSYVGLFAVLALMPMAAVFDERADRVETTNLKRLLVRLGLRFCIPLSCIAAVFLPQLLWQRPASSPANAHASECAASVPAVRSAVAALNNVAGLGAETRTIAAPIDMGPPILFLTRHRVLAAPYHRNTQGFIDNRRIFAGTEDEALATVRARAVDAILFCRKFVSVTTYADQPAFLNEHLGAGRPPAWLVPVTGSEDIGLYQVRSAASARRSTAEAPQQP